MNKGRVGPVGHVGPEGQVGQVRPDGQVRQVGRPDPPRAVRGRRSKVWLERIDVPCQAPPSYQAYLPHA
jgi:hypothetical protein